MAFASSQTLPVIRFSSHLLGRVILRRWRELIGLFTGQESLPASAERANIRLSVRYRPRYGQHVRWLRSRVGHIHSQMRCWPSARDGIVGIGSIAVPTEHR